MPLTEQEVQQVTTWLKARGVQGGCSTCGHKEWGIIDVINAPVHAPFARTTETVPVVATACGHCGHVVLFSAVMMGIR